MQSLKQCYNDKFSQISKTITSDNGSEFTELTTLENNTKTKVYFTHSYSSCKRVYNEFHNNLLRRFIANVKRIDKYTYLFSLQLTSVIYYPEKYLVTKHLMIYLRMNSTRFMQLNF